MAQPDAEFRRLEQFDAVDASGEAKMFQVFLDRVDVIPDVVARRARSYQLLGLAAGRRFADVGCGLGTAARELAGTALPGGEVFGFDVSQAMIGVAADRARQAGAAVHFEAADAAHLPLEAASLDGYRAERVFQHLADPAGALAEAYRLLAPGGRIVLIDQDWDGLMFESDELATTRLVVRAFADSLVAGTVGRRFHGLLTRAGFTKVAVEAETLASSDWATYGFMPALVAKTALQRGIDPHAIGRWLSDQQRRGARGAFFVAMTHFLGSATRG